MKTSILLLVQLALFLGLHLVSPSPFGLLGENAFSYLKTWQETTFLFAIPFCLLLFSLSKSRVMRSMKFLWGLWNGGLSGLVLWYAPIRFPEIHWTGMAIVAFNLVLGLSLTIHTLIEFDQGPSSKSKVPQNSKNSPGKAINQSLPKVEGV